LHTVKYTENYAKKTATTSALLFIFSIANDIAILFISTANNLDIMSCDNSLQCFDAVGWAAGSLLKTEWGVLAWLSA